MLLTTLLLPIFLICGNLSFTVGSSFACKSGYDGPFNFGKVQSHRIPEASGIASSKKNPGILWVHEDQGTHPYIYGLSVLSDPPGHIVAVIDLKDNTRYKERPDFEDISIAKCPHIDDDCIYMADVGDNCARLQSNGHPISIHCDSSYYLYAVPEPIITDHKPSWDPVKPDNVFEIPLTYPFTGLYPNIAMDSEAVVVSPDGKKAWLIEKRLMQADPKDRPTPARVYEASIDSETAEKGVQLELITFIDNPDGVRITGADLHPNGENLIVRTAYHGGTYLYLFDVPFDFKTIKFHGKIASNSLRQSQPEAVSYDYTRVYDEQVGKGIWHISEQASGYQSLEYVKCKDRDKTTIRDWLGG